MTIQHKPSSVPALKHALALLLLFLSLALAQEINNDRYDAAGQTVTYYPASMYLSHFPCALAFFSNTKLVHVGVLLQPLPLGPDHSFQTDCPGIEKKILTKHLSSSAGVQRSVKRLISMRSFSNLIECDSYLRRFYHYSTELQSRMHCPRIYKGSKTSALKFCRGIWPPMNAIGSHSTKILTTLVGCAMLVSPAYYGKFMTQAVGVLVQAVFQIQYAPFKV